MTPDTLDYMIGGYAIAFLIFGFLVLSIWWRYRMLAADEVALEQVQQETEKEVKPSDQAILQTR